MGSNGAKPEVEGGLAGFFKKTETWLVSEPDPKGVRLKSLITAAVMLSICIYALGLTSLFHSSDTGLVSSDLALSGTWKYKIANSPQFSDPSLSDSDWCLIAVPNAGLAPIATPHDHPLADCSSEHYPRTALRNHTYWYRHRFEISLGRRWKEPTLFLGAIKDRAVVYWDGVLLGVTRLETDPALLPLSPQQVEPGTHQIALQVQSAESLNPGIFHAYSKQVAVGEFSGMLGQIENKVTVLQEAAVVSVLQLTALLILSFFVFRTGGAQPQFFWLLIYFGSVSLYSATQLPGSHFRLAFESIAFIGMSTAVAGYGNYIFTKERTRRAFGNRVISGMGLAALAVQLFWSQGQPFDGVMILFSLIYVLAFGLVPWIWTKWVLKVKDQPFSLTEIATAAALLFLHFLHFYERVLKLNNAVFVHVPFWTGTLTVLVMILTAEEHIRQVQLLAFFGRFIRPGLKQLLWDFRHTSEEKKEWFRGRQIPLLKVDIVGYTDGTYKMPYGVKRLYQDLWYTHIDRVLEKISFFDLPEGDGSIYCISGDLIGGSCAATILAAEKLEKQAIQAFDQDFKSKLRLLLEAIPSLAEAFSSFLELYQSKSGKAFFDRQTEVRFVFHYSWVDEGLWGLKTKSHYNVAGDSLIELARLEKLAKSGEYLMTRPFYEQWRREDPSVLERFEFQERRGTLKGIGPFDYWVACRRDLGRSNAA